MPLRASRRQCALPSTSHTALVPASPLAVRLRPSAAAFLSPAAMYLHTMHMYLHAHARTRTHSNTHGLYFPLITHCVRVHRHRGDAGQAGIGAGWRTDGGVAACATTAPHTAAHAPPAPPKGTEAEMGAAAAGAAAAARAAGAPHAPPRPHARTAATTNNNTTTAAHNRQQVPAAAAGLPPCRRPGPLPCLACRPAPEPGLSRAGAPVPSGPALG